MSMGGRFIARFAGPSASAFGRSMAAVVGIVSVVAAFGWFVIRVPAVVSFAVAAGAAMAWCAWLEKHPDTPVDVAHSVQEGVTDTTRATLSVNVLATTRDGTRGALDVAKRLTSGLDARIVLLLPRLASFAGRVDVGSEECNALVDEHRALAADVGVHVNVLCCVCHRYDDLVHQMLDDSSLLVIGGRHRLWWPGREERLVRRLSREGYPVVFARVAAHSM